MDTAKLSMTVSSNEAVLDVSIHLNDRVIYCGIPGTTATVVDCEFNDEDSAEHTLSIKLSGKNIDHTKVDEQGNIVKDVLVTFSNFKLEDIDISQIVIDHAEYHHDFNGTQDKIVDSFHGTIGCNGTVIFKFQSPAYLWLLENM